MISPGVLLLRGGEKFPLISHPDLSRIHEAHPSDTADELKFVLQCHRARTRGRRRRVVLVIGLRSIQRSEERCYYAKRVRGGEGNESDRHLELDISSGVVAAISLTSGRILLRIGWESCSRDFLLLNWVKQHGYYLYSLYVIYATLLLRNDDDTCLVFYDSIESGREPSDLDRKFSATIMIFSIQLL